MSEQLKLTVSASPHTKSPTTVTGIMLHVIIAMIPAAFAGVMIFGPRAALVMLVCVASCVFFEFISRKIMKRKSSIGDLSAIVTGLLLAFNLPVSIPLWMCIVGSLVAIVVVKQMFGGIGHNFANPAITARIVMLVSFASAMTNFTIPTRSFADAVTSATPMSHLSGIDLSLNVSSQLDALIANGDIPGIFNMLFGVRAGCIGEVCSVALILGGLYLVYRGIISLAIPVSYILTVAVFMFIASGFNASFTAYEILGGGLILGAFFMATDYSTSPINKKGKIVFGIGCGILNAVIRLFGSLPEGVSYSILLMNIAVPLIEKATAPKFFGFVTTKKEKKEEAAS